MYYISLELPPLLSIKQTICEWSSWAETKSSGKSEQLFIFFFVKRGHCFWKDYFSQLLLLLLLYTCGQLTLHIIPPLLKTSQIAGNLYKIKQLLGWSDPWARVRLRRPGKVVYSDVVAVGSRALRWKHIKCLKHASESESSILPHFDLHLFSNREHQTDKQLHGCSLN